LGDCEGEGLGHCGGGGGGLGVWDGWVRRDEKVGGGGKYEDEVRSEVGGWG
jgi:hypothetical protein